MRKAFWLAAMGVAVVGAGCGAAPPAPSAPSAASAKAPAAPEPSAAPEPTKPAVESSSRKPRDVITDADMTFVLAFDSSDPGKSADEKCAKQSKGDSKKHNQCMTAARDKIAIDAMRFKEDDAHVWWWQSLRRRGNSETILHKVAIDFGEETDHSIVIKPKGRDTGTAPWARVPSEVQIEVPNSFSLSIKDPQHGLLVYEAKILLSDKK